MKNNQKGFTLIEILTVLSIIVLLITMSGFSYLYFSRKTDLEKNAHDISSIIELAQSKTLASEGSAQHGVHFESDKYVLFVGDTYIVDDINNKEYHLPSRLEISAINLIGGGQNTIFEKISGRTEQSGTVVIRPIAEPTDIRTITIFSSGRAEIESSGTICCDTNRIVDTRHLNLTLGWSIQGATTLTLDFDDMPSVNTDIVMADYFNGDQTEFNWSGVIDVNGENQELIIHTVFLDATNTILSIHRDQDLNNKPLEILIDSKDIISYTADGEVAIETYGGTAEAQ
ncbi:MAG: type II secretion system protein [bacterium]